MERGGKRASTRPADPLEHRMARRLAALRAERGWTLDTLARRTRISRASLSRLERGELSPTASMLNTLCAQYGWTASRVMAEAESRPPSLLRAGEQLAWKDRQSRFLRRVISSPHASLKGELVEVTLPPRALVSYAVSPLPGLEHHLWMLEGVLSLDIEGNSFRLQKGDCLRYILSGPSRFACSGKRPARYLLSIIHP